jgi:hypothetical protein
LIRPHRRLEILEVVEQIHGASRKPGVIAAKV